MKEGRTKTKETLCWTCRNCTRCSWADGIPVKGWTAKPTIVHDHDGDFNSYLVEECPQFKEDAKRQVTTQDMADILGKTFGEVARALRSRGGIIFLRGWLREKGYKLSVYEVPLKNGKSVHEFIIRKITPQ